MDPDDLERLAVQVAAQIVARVRSDTPEDNQTWLWAETTSEERDALFWILAAAVPIDEPIRQLLAWCRPEVRAVDWTAAELVPEEPQRRQLKPCGTTAAARRHRYRNEELCDLCKGAVRVYSANVRKGARRLEAMQHDPTSTGAGGSPPAACA